MATPHLSLIIPVYNRPNEVEELLDSLTRQSETNFEVVIVEDGSKETCQHVVCLLYTSPSPRDTR